MEETVMEKIDDYLQINEAAAYLGISPSTLRNWEKQGKLSTHRNPINSYRLYKKKDLENLLKSIRNSSTSK
jgi:MerR family transcriptional regulator, copper efflux regulator